MTVDAAKEASTQTNIGAHTFSRFGELGYEKPGSYDVHYGSSCGKDTISIGGYRHFEGIFSGPDSSKSSD